MSEQVVGRRVVLAIDVAKEDFVAAIFCDDALVATIKWAHPHETAQLLAGISGLRGAGSLEAAMEPSGRYGDALRWLRH